MAEKIIGIDLGTTNSCVAISGPNGVETIKNAAGYRTTPSVVAFTKDGHELVGVAAKRQAVVNSANTISAVKRLIGKKFNSISSEQFSYKIVRNKHDGADIELTNGRKLSPAEVSASILTEMKKAAEAYLGTKVTKAVITVPAYFDDAQRNETKDAGRIAGLDVVRIINEPTAAALAYGLEKNREGKTIVYDLGGGTFDVSLLEIHDGVFEVKATNGDTHLGGEDFDNTIINYLVTEFKGQNGIDLSKDKTALQRLKEAAEKAKIELSTMVETDINLPFITSDSYGPKHLDMKLTRSKFESLVDSLIMKTLKPCEIVLKDANIKKEDLDTIIFVGGMTRMPKVRQKVEEFFGKKGRIDVDPDEIVAHGAARQGAILAGDNPQNVVLLDVTPLSLGIETLGGIFTRIIEKNTTIPTKKSQVFSTAADNQTTVSIRVFQGEREMAADNKILGQFDLTGIPSAPRGMPQIEVAFDIDSNGIVHVTAKDKATGRAQEIKIQASNGLTEEEIQKMKANAEKYQEEDKKRRSLVEEKNKGESQVYAAEKVISENAGMSPDLKTEIEDKIKSLKEMLSTDDLDGIKAAEKSLSDALMKVYENLSKNQQNSSSEESN